MKKFHSIIGVLIIISIACINAEIIHFSETPERDGLIATCGTIARGPTSATFLVRVPAAQVVTETVNGTEYKRILVRGLGNIQDVGKPNMPALSYHMAVPRNGKATVTVLEEDAVILDNYLVHPALRPHYDDSPEEFPFDTEPEFVTDQTVYSKNAFFPASPLTVVQTQIYRGTPICLIQVCPVLHNPVTKQIKVYKKLKVRIDFSGVDLTSFVKNDSKKLLKSITINGHEYLQSVEKLRKEPFQDDDEYLDYLILTLDDYMAAAESLAVWKRMQGYDVKIESNSSWTTSTIKSTIRTFYDENNSPEYFLILGDHDEVPAENASRATYSDLYYACMDGSDDYHPDIARGRIPVGNASEAMMIIQKILKYQRTPPEKESFYRTFLACAQFQDSDPKDNYADRRFSLTAEEMTLYLRDSLGYDIERIYATSSSITPKYWNDGSYYFGDPIPDYLEKPGFPWDGNSTDIINAIDDGRFLVLHRDHGGTSGWGTPNFKSSNVEQLANGDLLPVVFSLNCLTGKFSGSSNCFAETFLRHDNGGCVGVVAASEVSMSGYNDAFCHGMFDAIWPGTEMYSPKNTNPDPDPHDPIYTLGNVLDHGLNAMEKSWRTSTSTFELFHWHGDPAMEIWTDVPQTITATHKDRINIREDAFDVSNMNITEGFATLYNFITGTTVGKAAISGANATVNLTESLNEGDTLLLTITSHNFIPYIVKIDIEVNASSFLVSVPAQNQLFDIKEDVTITWETQGVAVSNVMIEFSSDNGVTFSTIVASTANSGTYDWTTPDNVGSDQCYLRFTDLADTSSNNCSRVFSVWDISDVAGTVSGLIPAQVYYSGPSSGFLETDDQGKYKLEKLYPGDYKFFAISDVYSSDTLDLTLPPDTSGIDMEVLFPQITVSPSFFDVKIKPDVTADKELSVKNPGKRGLDYKVTNSGVLGKILINELYVSVDDFYDGFEMWNQGPDIDISGWQLVWNDNQNTSGTYTFPSGFALVSGQTIVFMDEESIGNDSNYIYSGGNLYWDMGETELSVAILDKDGKGVDFVRSSGNSDEPPEGTEWSGTGVALSNNSIYRNGNVDNDNKDDWAAADDGTFNLLNANQSNSIFPSWYSVSSIEGLVDPSATENLTFTFDATGLSMNTKLSDTLYIFHNSPIEASPIVFVCLLEIKDVIAPVALPKEAKTGQNAPVDITLEGTDQDGTIERYETVNDPSNGAVELNAEIATYLPTTDYVGADSFSYVVIDNDGVYSEKAWVTVDVITEIVVDDEIVETSVDFAAVPNPVDMSQYNTVSFVVKAMEIRSAELVIYDQLGNVIDRFETPERGNKYTWDFRNLSGRKVAGGTYLAVLKLTDSNGTVQVKKTQVGVIAK